jgi:uncharacterized protein (TIGR03084 family)
MVGGLPKWCGGDVVGCRCYGRAVPPDLSVLLEDLKTEHTDFDALVEGADLAVPSGAAGWTVGDCVGHLWFFDREATKALVDPEAFNEGLQRVIADSSGYMDAALAEAARAERVALLAALRAADPAAKVPWYGPPMSPASFATARLMEYWAHGQDVADGLGVERVPTQRLRHICHLGVRTRGFSYVVRGLPAPTYDVRVAVTSPNGELWTWGEESAPDRVEGSALDFCLVVTQRRQLADTKLDVTGGHAGEWLQIAQAFAGGPTTTDPNR